MSEVFGGSSVEDLPATPSIPCHPYGNLRLSLDQPPQNRVWSLWAGGLLVWVGLFASACWQIPLAGDEAYYWLWARHPALGYFDHPPAVAWTAQPLQWLLGGEAWVFRLSGMAMMLAAIALTARSAARSVANGRASVMTATVAMALVSPLLSHYLVEMGPDSPLLLGWALALEGASLALLEQRRGGWWIAWVGVALAILSKLTGWLLALTLVMLLVCEPAARTRRFYSGAFLALVLISPHLWWNAQHGWINYTFQWSLRVSSHTLGLTRLLQAPELLADLGVISLPALAALWWAVRRARTHPEIRLLLWFAAPIQLAFLAVRLLGVSRWNWPMPGYLASIALTAVWLVAHFQLPRLRQACALALVLTAAWSLLGLSARVFPSLPVTIARLQTSSDLLPFALPSIGHALRERPEAMLLSDEYTEAAALTYYSGRPVDLVMPHREGSQFLHWNTCELHIGDDALFLAHRPLSSLQHVLLALQRSFESYQRLDEWQVQVVPGAPPVTFYLVHCHRLRQNWLDHAPP
jgi:4-amino-4-deoxy-L-arabinose transferase-like glycosyltransferase